MLILYDGHLGLLLALLCFVWLHIKVLVLNLFYISCSFSLSLSGYLISELSILNSLFLYSQNRYYGNLIKWQNRCQNQDFPIPIAYWSGFGIFKQNQGKQDGIWDSWTVWVRVIYLPWPSLTCTEVQEVSVFYSLFSYILWHWKQGALQVLFKKNT